MDTERIPPARKVSPGQCLNFLRSEMKLLVLLPTPSRPLAAKTVPQKEPAHE
jgi:hypothetical protein